MRENGRRKEARERNGGEKIVNRRFFLIIQFFSLHKYFMRCWRRRRRRFSTAIQVRPSRTDHGPWWWVMAYCPLFSIFAFNLFAFVKSSERLFVAPFPRSHRTFCTQCNSECVFAARQFHFTSNASIHIGHSVLGISVRQRLLECLVCHFRRHRCRLWISGAQPSWFLWLKNLGWTFKLKIITIGIICSVRLRLSRFCHSHSFSISMHSFFLFYSVRATWTHSPPE